MAAALGEGLVFQLNHGGARTFKFAHGALRVQRIAKARVRIHDHGQAHAIGDVGQGACHFGGCGQANVGAPEQGIGDGGTRQIQRFKPCLLGDQGAEGVIHPWGQQHLRLLKALFQSHAMLS